MTLNIFKEFEQLLFLLIESTITNGYLEGMFKLYTKLQNFNSTKNTNLLLVYSIA